MSGTYPGDTAVSMAENRRFPASGGAPRPGACSASPWFSAAVLSSQGTRP